MSAYTDLQGGQWYSRIGQIDRFVTDDNLIWHIGRKNSGYVYIVPAGFAFDVSVPWWARAVVSRTDSRFMKAACLHDHMLIEKWDRTTAAGVFNDALRADGVSKAKRFAMFLAVASFKWA